MKKKLIISIALATVVLAMPVYSMADTAGNNSSAVTAAAPSSSSTSTAAVPSSLNLSLEDALSRIEKGNKDIILMDSEIAVYQRQYDTAAAQAKVQGDVNVGDDSDSKQKDLMTKNYYAPVALAKLNNAKHDKDDQIKSVKVEVTNEYQGILAAELNLQNINDQISNLKTTIAQVNQKIQLGLAKASDIEQYNAKMAVLQASLSSQQKSIDTAMLTLKQDVGIDLSTKLTLTSKPLDYAKFDDANIDDRIQKAIKNNYEFTRQKQDIDNENIMYKIYLDVQDNSQLRSTEIDLQDKQSALDKLPTTLEISLRTAYNNMKALENNLEAEKLSVESCQINLNVAQANYNVGKSTYLDVLDKQLALSTEKNTLQQNIISYMQAAQSFKNSLNE